MRISADRGVKMSSKLVIEERRRQVLLMLLNRIPIREIAKKLGWDKETIFRDIQKLRSEYRHKELAEDEDPVIDWLMRNAEQYRIAARACRKAEEAGDLANILKAVREKREIDKQRIDTMLATGLLQKYVKKMEPRELIIRWDLGQIERTRESDAISGN